MQPNAPPPAPPPVSPTGKNPYSFLFEEQKKSKKKLIPSSNSTKQRIILVLGGVVILLIIGVLVMSILGSSSAANKVELTTVAKQQTELIRVASFGVAKAKDSKVKNLALTTQLSLESSNGSLLAALEKNKLKISKKELATSKNAATDTLLTNAEQANNFDSVFSQELTTELTAYKTSAKQAFDTTSSRTTKAALSAAYAQASTLLTSSTN